MTGTQLTGEAALDAELSLPQYATMTDEEASIVVVKKTVVVRQPVPAATLRKTLAKLGRWGGSDEGDEPFAGSAPGSPLVPGGSGRSGWPVGERF